MNLLKAIKQLFIIDAEELYGDQLEQHLEKRLDTLHICGYCKKGFSSQRGLNTHRGMKHRKK